MKPAVMKYHLFWIFSLAVLSCTREAEVVIPAQAPALVLHGYIAAGDSFHITLGRTMGMKESLGNVPVVENAWVLVYENNIFADSLKYDATARCYVSGLVAKTGFQYKIVAGAPGFTTVEAVSSAPIASPTVAVNHLLNSRTSSGGTWLDDIKFSFSDPPAQDNYYITALYAATEAPVCAYTYDPVIEKYSSSLLPFEQGSCINSDEIIFTDKIFNGAVKEIILSASNSEMKTYTDPSGNIYKPFLKRYNVPKEHYIYFKNALAADANTVPTFSNPVSVKGNVKNGYGLFSIFLVTTDSIP